jgi:hypothetical protein
MKQTAVLTVLMMIFALLLGGCRDEGWYPSQDPEHQHRRCTPYRGPFKHQFKIRHPPLLLFMVFMAFL